MHDAVEKILYITSFIPAPHGSGPEKRAWQHLQGLKLDQRFVKVILLDWHNQFSIYDLDNLKTYSNGQILLPCHQVDITKPPFEGLIKLKLWLTGKQDPFSNVTEKLKFIVEQACPDLIFCYSLHAAKLWDLTCAKSQYQGYHWVVDVSYNDREYHKPRLSFSGTSLAPLPMSERQKLIEKANDVIVSSNAEANAVSGKQTASKLTLIPNTVTIRPNQNTPRNNTILCVTNFEHQDNINAVTYFCKKILPLIEQQVSEGFCLNIVSRHIPQEIHNLAKIKQVNTWENIEDLSPFYYRSTMAIFPSLVQQTSQIQLLEAMSYYVPVVCSGDKPPIDGLKNGVNMLHADTAIAMAKACSRLLLDEIFSVTIADNAHDLVKQNHCDHKAQRQIADLCKNGSVLQRKN